MIAKKNMEIERLRAMAVIGVMLAHCHLLKDIFPRVFRHGWSGVDLFFVISGYVVSLSLLRSFPAFPEESTFFERLKLSFRQLKNFYYKRLARILPMAIIWAVIPLILIWLSIQEEYLGLEMIDLAREFTSIMTFTYNYFYIFNFVPRLLGHYWSLSVEEQFYFILPLFFIFVPSNYKRLKWLLVLSVLIAFVFRFINAPVAISAEDTWSWIRFASHNRFDALCIGVIVYILNQEIQFKKYFSPSRLQVWIISIICLLGILIVPAIFSDYQDADRFNHLLFAISAAVLVVVATFETNYLLRLKFITPLLNWIGSRSYGLYLIHIPAEIMVNEYVSKGNHLSVNQMAGIWIILTAFLTELSYRLLEKPIISWARKFSV
ncbi:MAG: acyltransferase [Bacteriovorax sp.]|nr:acyltransferase [Bacteriovorax sp.]